MATLIINGAESANLDLHPILMECVWMIKNKMFGMKLR